MNRAARLFHVAAALNGNSKQQAIAAYSNYLNTTPNDDINVVIDAMTASMKRQRNRVLQGFGCASGSSACTIGLISSYQDLANQLLSYSGAALLTFGCGAFILLNASGTVNSVMEYHGMLKLYRDAKKCNNGFNDRQLDSFNEFKEY